ncbi:MAG: preprotein translocase subunit SecE [Deltaproteobacteria bacterium]|jgi:preprotein translocase subunit SecE|nr:preprotein translocase subunit SecE [Deltaproteobacteria bacterium]
MTKHRKNKASREQAAQGQPVQRPGKAQNKNPDSAVDLAVGQENPDTATATGAVELGKAPAPSLELVKESPKAASASAKAQSKAAPATVKAQPKKAPAPPRFKPKKEQEEVKPPNKFQRSINFFKEAKRELTRVNWPTRKETIHSTGGLLVFVVVSALYLFVVDSLINLAVVDGLRELLLTIVLKLKL